MPSDNLFEEDQVAELLTAWNRLGAGPGDTSESIDRKWRALVTDVRSGKTHHKEVDVNASRSLAKAYLANEGWFVGGSSEPRADFVGRADQFQRVKVMHANFIESMKRHNPSQMDVGHPLSRPERERLLRSEPAPLPPTPPVPPPAFGPGENAKGFHPAAREVGNPNPLRHTPKVLKYGLVALAIVAGVAILSRCHIIDGLAKNSRIVNRAAEIAKGADSLIGGSDNAASSSNGSSQNNGAASNAGLPGPNVSSDDSLPPPVATDENEAAKNERDIIRNGETTSFTVGEYGVVITKTLVYDGPSSDSSRKGVIRPDTCVRINALGDDNYDLGSYDQNGQHQRWYMQSGTLRTARPGECGTNGPR